MKLGEAIGLNNEDDFEQFDLTEIQKVLSSLNSSEAWDLAHAERLQQLCLRAADLLSDYSSRLVKTIGVIESSLNKEKNKAMVEYKSDSRVTADVRKAASEASPLVEEISIKLAKAKAAKNLLDKKYDIISKSFYYYKEIAAGFNKTIVGFSKSPTHDTGWE